MDVNYERLEKELYNLRSKVLSLEHLYMDLQKKYYALQTCYHGIQIKDYFEHYKPKAKMKRYKIVCLWPSEEWQIKELVESDGRDNWMEVYRCTEKKEEGYEEAKKWLKEKDK